MELGVAKPASYYTNTDLLSYKFQWKKRLSSVKRVKNTTVFGLCFDKINRLVGCTDQGEIIVWNVDDPKPIHKRKVIEGVLYCCTIQTVKGGAEYLIVSGDGGMYAVFAT